MYAEVKDFTHFSFPLGFIECMYCVYLHRANFHSAFFPIFSSIFFHVLATMVSSNESP